MKIVSICNDDHANFMHNHANALRSIGVNCVDVKLKKHPFGYASQSKVVHESDLSEIISDADMVEIFHTDDFALDYCKGKRTVVFHTGTRYRQRSAYFNSIFNPKVEMSICALPEFIGMGAKNEQYIVGAINTHRIRPYKKRIGKRIVVGHFPSNPIVKGSERINRLIDELKKIHTFEYVYSDAIVDYDEQLERMNGCDVYIELFNPEQNGKKYGSFGITALECASMGKVIMTQNLGEQTYFNSYGINTPFFKYESDSEFKRSFGKALQNIHFNQIKTRIWVEQTHSFEKYAHKIVSLYGLQNKIRKIQ